VDSPDIRRPEPVVELLAVPGLAEQIQLLRKVYPALSV